MQLCSLQAVRRVRRLVSVHQPVSLQMAAMYSPCQHTI